MTAITNRHQSALRELYQRYGKTLKSVITRVVHEEAEADDVLQEIFLQIWKEAGNYSPKAGRPLGWVVTLARRRAIDRLRRRQAYCRAKDRFELEHIEQRRLLCQQRDRAMIWFAPICAGSSSARWSGCRNISGR